MWKGGRLLLGAAEPSLSLPVDLAGSVPVGVVVGVMPSLAAALGLVLAVVVDAAKLLAGVRALRRPGVLLKASPGRRALGLQPRPLWPRQQPLSPRLQSVIPHPRL